MPIAFRATLEAPSHRRVNLESRRPCCCLVLTSGVVTFVFLVFGISSWSLYSHQFDLTEHRYNDGDQVALAEVARDFSTTFCDAYNVSLDDTGRIYVLSQHAVINTSETLTEEFALKRDKADDFTIREFYLLQHSKLDLVGCRENSSVPVATEVLFFKGRDKLRSWRHDQLCKDCIYKKMVIPDDVICSEDDSDPPFKFSITVKVTDDYAIIADYNLHKGKPREDSKVIINVTLTRTLFDLRNPQINCSSLGESKSCEFSMSFDGNYDVVVDFSGDVKKEYHGSLDASRKFQSRCSLRLPFWIFVFAGIPLILAFLMSFSFFWFLCRKRKNFNEVKRLSSQSEVKVQDDASLVPNEVTVHRREEDSCMAIQDG